MPCREIEQYLNLKIQKVRPKAKCPQKNKKKNKISTHPLTMPQAAGKKGNTKKVVSRPWSYSKVSYL